MIAALLRLLSWLPLTVLHGLAPVVYLFIFYVLRLRRQVVIDNLSRAFPEKDAAERDALMRQFFRHYADVLVEMVKSITIDKQTLLDRVSFTGEKILLEHLQNGQPVLATAAHQCNIEWLLLACCARFPYPFEGIYRPLANSQFEQLTYAAHRRFGGVPIKDRAVIREIMARRNVPRVVGIVSDQSPNLGDDKYWTTFMNQDTAFYLAPEVIAKFSRYPVVFLGMERTGRGRYQVSVSRLAEPPYENNHEITRRYVDLVEQQIRRDPSNWLWAHKRWKHNRPLYETG